MIQDGRELDHFTMGQRKYKVMENVMNILERSENRGDGWDIYWLKKAGIFIGQFGSIFINQKQHRLRRKGRLYIHRGGVIRSSGRW